MIFGEDHGDDIRDLKAQLETAKLDAKASQACNRENTAAWKEMLDVLRDYPKGQDDGSWIRRKDAILERWAP